MGADKIFSQRSNSVYAPNSQPRIPTRVCQGRVVTTDLPTLGTNPKQSQSESGTQEAKDLATLRKPGRTVRVDRADSPRGGGGRSARLRRTVRKSQQNLQYRTLKNGRSAPCHRTVREQFVSRGRSAASRRTVCETTPGQKQLAKWIKTKALENTRRTRRTPGRTTPHGQSACLSWMVRQARE
jgi:hypothetical protein